MTAQRIRGEPCGPGTFAVESASLPGVEYGVEWHNAAVRWCPCPAFARGNDCRHVRAVAALWRQEHEQAMAARRADPAALAAADERIERVREVFDG